MIGMWVKVVSYVQSHMSFQKLEHMGLNSQLREPKQYVHTNRIDCLETRYSGSKHKMLQAGMSYNYSQ